MSILLLALLSLPDYYGQSLRIGINGIKIDSILKSDSYLSIFTTSQGNFYMPYDTTYFKPLVHLHDDVYYRKKIADTHFITQSHTHGWTTITGKPTAFTSASHQHVWSQVTSRPTIFASDTTNSGFQTYINNHGAGDVYWNNILGKPGCFDPCSHGHGWTEITGKPNVYNGDTTYSPFQIYVANHAGSGGVSAAEVSDSCDNVRAIVPSAYDSASVAGAVAWGSISNKPSTFTPGTHYHNIADTVTAQNIEWSKVINEPISYPCADSAGKMDTTYGRFQTYVANHAGSGGMGAAEVSDSCDNVRDIIRDTIGQVDISWSKIINEPAEYDSAKNTDSLAHYSPARFTDTTRFKADSVRMKDSLAIKLAVIRFTADSTKLKVHLDSFPLEASRISTSTTNAGVTLALHDFLVGTPTSGQIPKWDGANWQWSADATTLGSGPSTVKLTADQAFTSTTRANVTGLSFSVTSGTYYHYRFMIIFQTAITTTGIKLCLNYPSVTTFSSTVYIPFVGDGAGANWGGSISATTDSVMSTGVQAATTNYCAILEGTILPSANGTLQVQAATEIASSAATIKQGTCGLLFNIP